MKRKSLGVPKWSQPRRETSRASGRASTRSVGRRRRSPGRRGPPAPGRSWRPDRRDRGAWHGGACRRPGPPGRCREPGRRWRRPAPPRGRPLPSPPPRWPGRRVRGRRRGTGCLPRRRPPAGRNRLGIGGGHPQQGGWRRARSRWRRPGPLAGRAADDVLLECGVGGGVVGLLGLAVAEQVDADHLPALLLEKVDPAGLAPVALKRRRKAVHQQHREIGHRGRLAARGNRGTGPAQRSSSVGRVARRIEIELTSARPDGSWTWRAAGRPGTAGRARRRPAPGGSQSRRRAQGRGRVRDRGHHHRRRCWPPRRPTGRILSASRSSAPAGPTCPGVTTQLVGRSDRRPGSPERRGIATTGGHDTTATTPGLAENEMDAGR